LSKYNAILGLLAEGKPAAAIASELKTSKQYVRMVAHRHEVSLRERDAVDPKLVSKKFVEALRKYEHFPNNINLKEGVARLVVPPPFRSLTGSQGQACADEACNPP
jgi:hypothetical protein